MIFQKAHSYISMMFLYVAQAIAWVKSSSPAKNANYGTAQLQLHFYTRGHAWHHAVFCVDGARFLRGKLICHESIRGISTG